MPDDPPLPEVEVRPEEMQRAAAAPDAPAELKAVAAAVRVGRTSWAVIAAGGGDQLPEVRALYDFADKKLAVALGEESAADDMPAEPAEEPRRRPDEYFDDEYMVEGVLRDDWQ